MKGAVEALDGRSFLSWKLGETAALGAALGVEVPVALMTSFQTDAETRAHVAGLGVPEPLWFTQSVSLRLTEDGALFLESRRPSPYAPGHGDLVGSIRTSGTLAALRSRGVEHLAISNVDNLGARLEALNKEYETELPIIISETTLAAAGGVLDARRLGEVTVKGRSGSERIYALRGPLPVQPHSDTPALGSEHT